VSAATAAPRVGLVTTHSRKEMRMPDTDRQTGSSSKGAGPQEPAQAGAPAPLTEKQLLAVYVSGQTPSTGPVVLHDYDPDWPRLFEREATRIHDALGDRALLLEHVGSTAVPGLAAKPRIDILLVVADSVDEPAYVPVLEAAGYVLRLREPDWHQHRLFRGPDTDINLHVFSPGCPEVDRMLVFRDRLRRDAADRQLYEQTKRELARREWKYVQHYADAKAGVGAEILARAQSEAGSRRDE
jgi:GrpB-like predicted nucleotidyltransferase (UPF0157 family)